MAHLLQGVFPNVTLDHFDPVPGLVTPQHALYEARLCQPLNDGVMKIPGIREETEGEVAAVVDGIINSAGRGVLKGFK